MSQPGGWIGHTLGGRYEIKELIGQGGMSAVYKATDPNLRRTVAVKLIHGHLSSNPEFIRRFEEEAAAVAQLSHSNIIQVFDFNHEDDTYYMVLEFLPGETLQERLKRLSDSGRQMTPDDAMEIMASVCDGVEYAHKRGLIHRDIKPANIMLAAQGQPVLMDFGVVKMVGSTQHTATGAVIGTALYMSPEQVRGEIPDERADIYSLGVTLFEMLSGSPPYEADSAMTTMMMHLNDPVPDILALNPRTPASLKAIIEKALAKAPQDRFHSAGEMATALRSALAGKEMPVDAGATLLETEPDAQLDPEGTLLETPAPRGRKSTASTERSSPTDAQRAPASAGAAASEPRKKRGLSLGVLLGGGAALLAIGGIVVVGIIVVIAVIAMGSGPGIVDPVAPEVDRGQSGPLVAPTPLQTIAPVEASGGASGGVSLTVVNDSQGTICYLYVTLTTDESWGNDVLGSDVIPPGSIYEVSLASGTYDMKAEDCDHRLMNGSLEQVIDGPVSWTVFEGGGSPVPVTVTNNTGTTICYLEISPSQAGIWGDDWLDETEVINAGASRTFDVPSGDYWLRASDCDVNVIAELQSLSFTSATTLSVP